MLPILHLNGFKIGERTVTGTMDDLELACLFTGYGYQVRIVEYGINSSDEDHDKSVHYDMAVSMEWALSEIRTIQQAARAGKPMTKPRWPMLVMRTPKGWTGPRKKGDSPIEGSWRSHQVPLTSAATDDEEFRMLEDWLRSYKPHELFSIETSNASSGAHEPAKKALDLISEKALRIIPKTQQRRMGMVDAGLRLLSMIVSNLL